ncbi:MAG: methionine--tRNA ligase [Candidatus Sumerlaeia bacterium]|nr:methionine--tRNA ligase [Candidatus Sumerlaeia bacterium]
MRGAAVPDPGPPRPFHAGEHAMTAKPRYYITTPLYYVNDVPHLGHAFEVVGIDVQARFRRLLGHPVHLLTGTDEHGQKNAAVAAARGIHPRQHVDEIAAEFRRVWDLLLISYDDFIRTTEPRHHRASHQLWRAAQAAGDIYLGSYEGWYDVKEEAFITETEMKAQGLEPDGKRIRRVSEESYFFRLEKYRLRVREHIEANPGFVLPEMRRNEVLNSFLANPLPDLSISRTSLEWGIPVPGDERHVMYVWFDALTNYATGVGYGDPEQAERFAEWWPADCHVIGKDILKFHAVIWPAMLMSAGVEPPRQVFGHGFINVLRRDAEGGAASEKMSKSAGNSVNPLDYVKQVGVEPLRYFLMREMNYGGDGVFNEEALAERHTADLANSLGNLVSRTTGMAERYLGGAVRRTTDAERGAIEREIAAAWDATAEEYLRAMPAFEYHTALARLWEFYAVLNGAINRVEPWALAKKPEEAERLRVFLCAVLEGIAHSSVLLDPFMPGTARRIRAALGMPEDTPAWDDARRWGGLFETLQVKKAEPLFPRLEQEPKTP